MTENELDIYFKNRLELELKDPVFLARQLIKSEEKLQLALEYSGRLEAERLEMLPKVEAADALIRSEKCISVSEAFSHFQIQPRKRGIPYLREQQYLTMTGIATQKAIQAGFLKNRINIIEGKEIVQAVVELAMLPRWNARLIPNIRGAAK